MVSKKKRQKEELGIEREGGRNGRETEILPIAHSEELE